MSHSHIVCTIFVLFVASKGAILTWNIFSSGKVLNSTSNLKDYASQRLSALRNLRDKLHDSEKIQFVNGNISVSTKPTLGKQLTGLSTIKKSRTEESLGNIFKSFDSLMSLAKPLKKMISSKNGIETLTSVMMPKRDILKKLLEIKGHLEPNLKRYLTDKYNWFLTSLIPYSENIGVPPFVLNSMKIPQDFDPRWQFIKSLLESQGGLEKFLHSVVNGESFAKLPEVIESRSGDETELISDQEPDASDKAYRKHQQLYFSAFKKRQMKPANRLKYGSGSRPSVDYDNFIDQQGQYGQLSYEVRAPEDSYSDSYYSSNAGGNSANDMDMIMSASGHGGRGHGGGGGYGNGQASYGGFLDPFTILGGLAFLTYLGLMLQNSLNRNMTGRSFPNEYRMPLALPINLKAGQIENSFQAENRRHERSLDLHSYSTKRHVSLTVDQVVEDVTSLWKDIQELKTQPRDPNCIKYKLCKIIRRLKEINMGSLFSNELILSPDDQPFVEHLMRENLALKGCELWIRECFMNKSK